MLEDIFGWPLLGGLCSPLGGETPMKFYHHIIKNIIPYNQILIKQSKLSGRGYFGLASLGGILLAFGGRGSDDQALASVGHQ